MESMSNALIAVRLQRSVVEIAYNGEHGIIVTKPGCWALLASPHRNWLLLLSTPERALTKSDIRRPIFSSKGATCARKTAREKKKGRNVVDWMIPCRCLRLEKGESQQWSGARHVFDHTESVGAARSKLIKWLLLSGLLTTFVFLSL